MIIKNIDTTNGNIILQLNGEMEAYSKQAYPHSVLDIEHVSFLDFSGIGAIVFLFKRFKQQGCSMEIVGVQGQLQELMKLLRIGTAIPLSFANFSTLKVES